MGLKVITFGYILMVILFFPRSAIAQTGPDWNMAGANPQRTSWVSTEVRGPFNPVWYRPIDPYIDPRVQVIASEGKVFVSSAKGLYAYDAANGSELWVYGTELPLGHSPTYANGTLYVGGYDHKVHAIHAADGSKKWISEEAEAGFDTNPLVINDAYTGNVPLILLGNRDGNFYAFNNDGTLKWKYPIGSPINYSAAYKNGKVYFGADDAYAYALNVSNGTLAWKSAKFPGVGFDLYWPVIWTDTTVTPNKDWVIFTGSLKSSWTWFVGNIDTSHQQNIDMFSGSSGCTNAGSVSYLWPAGSTVLDCSLISNYYKNKPAHRFTFILDPATGTENTGTYAPFNPSPHDGGGQGYRQPPIVGFNNVLYTLVGYISGGNGGSNNGVVGWKFGSPFISQTVNDASAGTDGAGDEPRTLTSGGNMVYYGEGFNHQVWGAIEVSKPLGSNALWKWNTMGVTGATAKYSSITLSGKFGGPNGSYSYFDGLPNLSPIPYNGKLFYIQGNVLFALSSGGSATAPLPMSQTPSQQSLAGITITTSTVNQKLESEIQKIIDSYTQTGKILRPGFHDSHHVSGSMVLPASYAPYHIPGEHMSDYFSNPSDTVRTLVDALPYLSSTLQAQVKTYLQNNFGPGKTYDVSKIVHTGWQNGTKREWGEDTPEMTATISNSNGLAFYLDLTPKNSVSFLDGRLNTGSFTPESFYGAWKYAQAFPTQAKTLFDGMKNSLPVPGTGNDMGYAGTSDTNSNLAKYPYILNQYLTGYRGYLELEKMAGYTSDISQSTKYAAYQNLLSLKINTFSENSRWRDEDYFINVFNNAGNYMYLTPEVSDALRTSSKASQITTAINNSQILGPYWFVSKYPRSISESYSRPLYDYPALFQARAYILKQPFSELVKYLDVPAFEKGDLFYIQNLVAALQASGNVPSPTAPTNKPGDFNGDGKVDFMDLQSFLPYFSQTSTQYNLSGTSVVDIFDLNKLFGYMFK